jgi:hypothetical protein
VKTGNGGGAGSNAKVFLKVFGDKATTGTITLNRGRKNFGKGQTRTFTEDMDVDIGKPRKMQVWHNTMLGDWFLDKVSDCCVGDMC